MQCYACERDAGDQCTNCRRWFCSLHGSGRCDRCRDIPGAYPSELLYRAILGMFVVVLALAGWQLAAWPQFGPMPALSVDGVGANGSPSESSVEPQASVSPEPKASAAPASPTPVPTPLPTATPAQRRYTVQSGDTMSDIAQRFGITTAALIVANPNVDPNVMRIGTELTIPSQ